MYQQSEEQRYCYNQSRGCNGTAMVKKPERNVTIDECPRCKDIILNQGELGAILATIASQPGFSPQRFQQHRQPQYGGHGHHGGHGGGHHHRSSSDSFFGGFFESS